MNFKVILFISLHGFIPVTIPAQNIPQFKAQITESHITIDGVLDEDVWSTVEPISGFRQLEPAESSPATQETKVRVLFGKESLFIGAILYDDPGKIEKALGRRDEYNRADWFLVSIDSYFNRRIAYSFGVNAAGVQMDGQRSGSTSTSGSITSEFDLSWNAIWFSSVSFTDVGWIVEMRIPYSMLRFPDVEDQTWGFHFTRRRVRNSEISEWPFIPRTDRSNLVARFAHATNIRDIHPKTNLQVRPYIIGSMNISENPDKPGTPVYSDRYDAGGDVKVGIGPNIILDATFNPDFGQVEADPAVLNLTAFETFYVEKRPFFMEGADIYDFGIGSSKLFYSRRVGATDPIVGAAKLSGRTAKGLSFGFLGAMAGENLNPSREYAVGRLNRQIGSYSSAGGILTAYNSPEAKGDGWKSYTGGIDCDLRFFNNNFSISGIAAFSNRNSLIADRAGQSGFMSGMTLAKRQGVFTSSLMLLVFSDQYNPNDLGWTSFERNFYESNFRISYQINKGKPFGPFIRANTSLFHRQRISYIEGMNMGDRLGLRTSGITRNFQSVSFNFNFSELFGGYDIFETRGLLPWKRPTTLDISAGLSSDERKNWQVSVESQNTLSQNDGSIYSLETDWSLNLGTRLSFLTSVEGKIENNLTAWASNEIFLNTAEGWMIGNASSSPDLSDPSDFILFDDNNRLASLLNNVTPVAQDRYYISVFGERNTRSMDFTLRSSYTLTNKLSLQLYSQLFLARTKYENFSLMQDTDHLAGFDAYPKRREFDYKNIQSNFVLRWEYRPGSTLYFVWGHNRRDRDILNPLAPWGVSPYEKPYGTQLSDLMKVFPANSFALKIDYAIF